MAIYNPIKASWIVKRKREEEEEKKKKKEEEKNKEEVKTPTPITKPTPTQPQVLRGEGGRITGVISPTGKHYPNIGAKEVKGLIANWSGKLATPAGAVEASDVRAQEQQQEFKELLTQNLGAIQSTGDVERDKISYEQAWKSALAGTATSPATLAGVGTAGAALATGIGAPAAPFLAAGGVVVGFISEMKKNIKEQRGDIIAGEAQNLRKNEANLLRSVMMVKQAQTPEEMIEIREGFDQQLALMDEDYSRLQLETNADLTKWLGQDGHPQLERYLTFNAEGGTRDTLVLQMKQAINNPSLIDSMALSAQISTLEEPL